MNLHGYKNPCTWKNGMCKFKVYQFPKKNLQVELYHIFYISNNYIWILKNTHRTLVMNNELQNPFKNHNFVKMKNKQKQ